MAPRRLLPSQAYLQECFTYDPDTGVLTWKARPRYHFASVRAQNIWTARFAGKVAGSVSVAREGHLRNKVTLNNVKYVASRAIYKMVYNEEPLEVDHENMDPSKDNLENLRPADHSDNMHNRRAHRDNVCGFKGVTATPKDRYAAAIMSGLKRRYLGTFDTPEEAHAAYCEAATLLHGAFARAS